jgi:hypothetical protein
MKKYCLWVMVASALVLARIELSAQVEINALLMESTFKIVGPSQAHGKQNVGTVFVVGKPSLAIPERLKVIMVTANHVLAESMQLKKRHRLGIDWW